MDAGVPGTESYALTLDGRRQDAAAARAFLRDLLPTIGWGSRVDDACLLLTELIANVALHARTACRVTVTSVSDELRISVEDASPVPPQISRFSDHATTGRGLRLVERLSDGWGSDPVGAGKAVWFSFDRTTADGSRTVGSR